jgi:hypothetical protein
MTRHCVRIHNIEYSKYGENAANVRKNAANVRENAADVREYKCSKCDKVLTQKRYLIKHEEKCNGIINTLECHLCHKVFSARSTKCEHMKTCNQQCVIPNNTSITTNNNSNNNTINNAGTINITNNIITFKEGDHNSIEFITKHITNSVLKELIAHSQNNENGETDMVERYTRQLLANPENRCIKKTNLRSVHSKVHLGDNTWQTRHDKEIYPKFVCDVANDLDGLIKSRRESDVTIIDSRTLKAIEKTLDYIAGGGYCNDEALEKEIHQSFKELVQRVKAITFDVTKMKV